MKTIKKKIRKKNKVFDDTCASHAGNTCLKHCDADKTSVFQNSRVTYIPNVKKSHR